MLCDRRSRRGAPPTKTATVAAVVAVLFATAARMSATAFLSAGTAQFSSTTTRSHTDPSTNLFLAHYGSEEEESLIIHTVTDSTLHLLLPPPDGMRPVLVDVFGPQCGPCKMLNKVLKQAQPSYRNRVDFVKWNVNDKDNTEELKRIVEEAGIRVRGLPSLIVFREGKPVAVRQGFANEFQLDYFLEQSLPDVLERTFDEDGIKMVPLPEYMMGEAEEVCGYDEGEIVASPECGDGFAEEEGERSMWQNRTSVPAMKGIPR